VICGKLLVIGWKIIVGENSDDEIGLIGPSWMRAPDDGFAVTRFLNRLNGIDA